MVISLLLSGAMMLAKEFAPSIIESFAGEKAGEIAKNVLDMGAEVTGEKEPEAIAAALRNNPELALQFQTRSAEIGLEHARLVLANTKDARKRDVTMKRLGYHNWRADIMIAVAFATLAFVTWLIYQARMDIPDGVLAIFNMMVGILLKMLSDAFNFEFGSSRGSKEKDLK